MQMQAEFYSRFRRKPKNWMGMKDNMPYLLSGLAMCE